MADVSLDDLIARARLESGLRTNAYYDSDQIIRYLDAGGAELADIFTNANQHYVISQFNFTTAGQADAIVSLPTDFQQGHSLEVYPDVAGQTRTIRYLSNWLNRNSFVGASFALAPGGFDPVYTFLDNKLRFYPPQCTPSAPFRLYYTPQWVTLAAPVTTAIAIDVADSASDASGFIRFTFSNFTFSDSMIGGTITVTWGAGDEAFSVTDAIMTANPATPATGHTIITDAVWPGGSFSGPASGTASVTIQPTGTRATLPGVMAPWSEYLVVYAAIAINADRQRGTGELERKLNALKARVNSTIGQRQEEPQQPPLTRGVTDGWGGGWGSGWGGGF